MVFTHMIGHNEDGLLLLGEHKKNLASKGCANLGVNLGMGIDLYFHRFSLTLLVKFSVLVLVLRHGWYEEG